MSVRRSLDGVRPAWGTQGRGVVWLTIGIGSTFVLGLALQLIALRVLDAGDYATFVLALSLGNVASAIAGSVQPVVAMRTMATNPHFLPTTARRLTAASIVAVILGIAALAPGVGWTIALLACLQIPLHTVLGIGTGRLQARHAFGAIALSLVVLSVVRVLIVMRGSLDDVASPRLFAIALPIALLTAIMVVGLRGGFARISWATAPDGPQLLRNYALWAVTAWLINGDAVYARLRLSDMDAGAYALAFTLGRQPLYAVAPLAMVLLPVALASRADDQRARLRAILIVSLILTLGTVAVLAPWPREIIRVLTGNDTGSASFVRGYALIGSLDAAATLLLTFAFALGRPPRLGVIAAIAAMSGTAILTLVNRAGELLVIQGIAVLVLTATCYFAARTSVDRLQPVLSHPRAGR